MSGTYVCSTTRMRVRGPLQMLAFLRASVRSTMVAIRTPGVVRVKLLGLPPFPVFWTLTVWESEEAMLEFVRSPQHRAAMAGFEKWASRGRFTRFSSETRRVSWLSAFRALRDPDGTYRRGVGYTRRESGSANPQQSPQPQSAPQPQPRAAVEA